MGSKLGFHIQKRRQGWPNAVADAVPALIKSLEWGIIDEWVAEEQTEPAKIERARKWAEYKVFLLGRQVVSAQSLDRPEDRAFEFWNRLLSSLAGGKPDKIPQVIERMRRFDAWEGYNEVGTGPDIANLGRFDAALARHFHSAEIKYAGGGFSMTKPTLDEWPLYCRALLDQVDSGRGDLPDFFHLHEYWFPPSNWSELLRPDGNIDAGKMRAATHGYMLHWRELYEHPETPTRMKLPVLITECGWDQGWPQQVGYRRSPRTDEDYVKWLTWYDQELRQPLGGIDYVVGAAIYTYGHELKWVSFEIDQYQGRGVINRLRTYLREQNAQPHPWDWQAAWHQEEGPKPPAPPEQETHYVLMAQSITTEWRRALERYLDAYKATSGQSLDDAVRLAADWHHITLVGSADAEYGVSLEWEAEIRQRNDKIIIDRLRAHTADELRRAADLRAERNDRYGAHEQA